MKFEFQNLGTIKKTTLDLRPLTVILGPNNTSKTYLAYCVHGLIKSLRSEHTIVVRAPTSQAAIEPKVQFNEIVAGVQEALQDRGKWFAEQLPEYFQDTYGGLFRETRIALQASDKTIRDALIDLIREEETGLVADEEYTLTLPGSRRRLSKSALNTLVTPYLVRHLPGASASLTLPAERNAFIITYKILSARRYRVLRDQARHFLSPRNVDPRQISLLREQGDIRYPEPIEDFLDFLTDVELEAARPRNNQNSPFARLARLIEQHIQSGHRTSYKATQLGGQELTVAVDEQTTLDLYNASSSIKQLAPLLLYLRYRAAPNQTLIIDEPEMNLHPEGQAKFLEALGMLANLGVRVLLTTHSPYFMAHLNNLIASDSTSPARKKRQAQHLYMGDPAAFLSPDDVSAYEMRPEGLVSLFDEDYGIRWDTLSDVSAELQRRYFAIVEEPKRRAKTA